MTEMKSPNAHARENRNDTPRKRKTHIIKVRVTAEEKLRIAYACKELHLTQSELVRRVLYGVNVKHTVVVAQGGEDALASIALLKFLIIKDLSFIKFYLDRSQRFTS